MELDPNADIFYAYLGLAYVQKGMYAEGVRSLKKALDISGDLPEYSAELAYACAVEGNSTEARRILAQLESRSRRQYVSSYNLAWVCAGLGQKEAALARLEKGYKERADKVPLLGVDPVFDSLRSDPRFQELLRRIGL